MTRTELTPERPKFEAHMNSPVKCWSGSNFNNHMPAFIIRKRFCNKAMIASEDGAEALPPPTEEEAEEYAGAPSLSTSHSHQSQSPQYKRRKVDGKRKEPPLGFTCVEAPPELEIDEKFSFSRLLHPSCVGRPWYQGVVSWEDEFSWLFCTRFCCNALRELCCHLQQEHHKECKVALACSIHIDP